uniref:Uncharacterized protein n=1 Tax=Anguilla anguilla TaxID=7936 RepID=A0A0E9VW44_ANGAN
MSGLKIKTPYTGANSPLHSAVCLLNY